MFIRHSALLMCNTYRLQRLKTTINTHRTIIPTSAIVNKLIVNDFEDLESRRRVPLFTEASLVENVEKSKMSLRVVTSISEIIVLNAFLYYWFSLLLID